MPVPPDFIEKVSHKLATAVIPLLNELWDRCEHETKAKIAASIVGGPPTAAPRIMSALDTVAAQLAQPRRHPMSATEAVAQKVFDLAMSPQKRGAQNREKKGVVKNAIRAIIFGHPDGITRGRIRAVAAVEFKLTIKDGSLRQGLRLLKNAEEITNRDGRWFPAKNGGQSSD